MHDDDGEPDDGLVYDKRAANRLNGARVSTRRRVGASVLRMYSVLESQRLAFVSRTPNHPLAGGAEATALMADGLPQDEAARARRVDESFKVLEHHGQLLASAVASVRLVEIQQTPSLVSVPAALAFAVSGPCTSWSHETWQECGLPRVVELLRKAFLAAFSGPKRTDNRASVQNGLPPCPEATLRSKLLSNKRSKARFRMGNSMKSLLSNLQQHRERFVKANPHHPLARVMPPSPVVDDVVTLAAAEAMLGSNGHGQEQQGRQQQALDVAYEAMDLAAPGFIKAVADARTALLSLEPAQRFRPAVVAFCADAPGTCWNPRMWHQCAFPRLVSFIQQVFIAAFSSPNMTENLVRLPKKMRMLTQSHTSAATSTTTILHPSGP